MKRAPNQPTSDLVLFAGIFLKTYTVPDANTVLPQHSHEHPHISLIVRGSVRAWREGDGDLGDFHAPAAIKIPARTFHGFVTLTDDVAIACIHNADHLDAGEPAIHALHELEIED